jgi:hypothetical protein
MKMLIDNHRVVRWRLVWASGHVVAGGGQWGDGLGQLHGPSPVRLRWCIDNRISRERAFDPLGGSRISLFRGQSLTKTRPARSSN